MKHISLSRKYKHIWSRIKQFISYHSQALFWLSLGGLVLIVGAFFIWVALLRVPTISSFDDRKVVRSTKIYDRTGEIVLYDVFEDIKRTIVTSEEISQYAKDAIVAIEDREFYQHNGIRIRSTIRGIMNTVLAKLGFSDRDTQGGSTLTQQVVKNTLLTQDQKVSRKLKEWILSVKIEQRLSKDEILTLYLNEAPYGGTIYGIQEASLQFFKKNASELTLAESAYLAAIPNAPSFYSPYGRNTERLNMRKDLVLSRMFENGFITEQEYDDAKNEEVVFQPREKNSNKAIHFVEWIRAQVERKYGRDAVLNGGLQIYTTLDYGMQEVAENAIYENSLINQEQYNASNSALVAIDPKTGEILSMVGSRDYFDDDIDGKFNVTTAERQPGSAFKPFIYAESFVQGFTPETVVFDTRTQFSGSCAPSNFSSTLPCYSPENYDGQYKGPITLRNALGQSRNIPAVKLLYLVGTEKALQRSKDMGITTLDRNADRYGLTLVLGGGEVTLLEMTSAYGVFANDGVRAQPTGILKIVDAQGNALEEFSPRTSQVLDPQAARLVNDVLKDNDARTPLFGARSFLFFGNRDVAGKTGTTNDNKDAWLIGYSPEVVVGVWSGNNDNTPMRRGSSISGPAWRTVMDYALRTRNELRFPLPEKEDPMDLKPILRGEWKGGESFFVDTISGKLATEFTPLETRKEYIIPAPHDILHWVTPGNPRGPIPENPGRDSQYSRWEFSAQNWINQNRHLIQLPPQKPSQFDDVHIPENFPTISFDPLYEQTTYTRNQTITITPTLQSTYPITRIDYYINNQFIGTVNNNPFSITLSLDDYDVGQTNTLRAVATDSVFNRGETTIQIMVQ